MTFDIEIPRGVLLHYLRNLGQHRLGLFLDSVAGEIEIDPVDDRSTFFDEILFDTTGRSSRSVGTTTTARAAATRPRGYLGAATGLGRPEWRRLALRFHWIGKPDHLQLRLADAPLESERIVRVVEYPELCVLFPKPSAGMDRRQFNRVVIEDHFEWNRL